MKKKEKIANVLNNRVVKNAGWLIFGKIAQMCINLFVGLLTARYLGPSNYGVINYGSAYTAFFLNLCTLGINSVLVKEFVDYPNEEGKIIGTTLGLKGVASVLSAISIMLISSFIDANEPTTILVVALCSIGLVFNILDTFNYWFQSKLQSKVTAMASLIAFAVTAAYKVLVVALCSIGLVFNILDTFNYWFQSKLQSKVTAMASLIAFAVTAAYKVYLMVTDKSVVYFAFATSIDYMCIGVLLILVYNRYKGSKLCFSWEYGKKLLKSSTPFIIPGLMVAIYGQTDKMMLKQMISDAEIGYYSTAVSICTMWCFILSAIIDSMYPIIMEAYNENKNNFIHKNKILYAIIFYCCILVSVFITVFAKVIVKILYGNAYLPTVNPLRIITWYTAFSYLGLARNAWIVCENKQKYLTPVYASAALANVILNLIFIPLYGASGAAVASLIAQILTTIVVPFMIPTPVYASAALANVILNLIFIPLYGASGAAVASLIAQILTTIVVPFMIPALKENSKLMIEAILFKGIWKREH